MGFSPKLKAHKFFTTTNAAEMLPVDMLVKQFLQEECDGHKLRAYETAMRVHFMPFLRAQLGTASVSYLEVTKVLIVKFMDEMLNAGAIASAAQRVNAVKAFCRWASDRLDVHNPAKDISPPKPGRPTFRGLTHEEVQRCLCVATRCSPRIRFTFELLMWTGVRNFEAASLRLENISPNIEWLEVLGKGRKRRRIEVSAHLKEAFCRYMKWREDLPGDYLLVSESGRQLDEKTIWSNIRSIGTVARIGEEVRKPHALRHTFAYRTLDYLQVDKGLTAARAVIKLRDMMGHSTTETTMQYLGCDDDADFGLMRDFR